MATVEEAKRARQQAREAGGQSGRRQGTPEGTSVDDVVESAADFGNFLFGIEGEGTKTVSTGLLDVLGFPGSIGQAVQNLTGSAPNIPGPTNLAFNVTGRDSPDIADLPSGGDLRAGFNEALQAALGDEDVEGVYPPGEEPETFRGRFFQNLGSMAVPMSTTGNVSRGMGRLAKEVGSEAAGAALGLQLQNTTTFRENPTWGRLVGEMIGGTSVPFVTSGGGTRLAAKGARKAVQKGRAALSDEAADTQRAAQRGQDVTTDPEATLNRLEQGDELSEEMPVQLPAFLSNDPGAQALTISAARVDPDFAQEFSRRASEEASELRKLALETGDPEDAAKAVDKRLQDIAGRVTASTAKFRRSGRIPEISNEVTNRLKKAFRESREMESKVWNKTPKGVFASPSNTRSAVKQLYKERTTKAARDLIPKDIKDEFGELKNGKLVGGEFSNKTPKAKQLHEIYSALGDKLSKAQTGEVTPAQTRIINNMRQAILDDLDNVEGGERYREAIEFSKDLNEKFTKGEVGSVLGFQRGEGAEPNILMDKLAGKQGAEQANAVDQLLRASPDAEDNVRDFLRSSFFTENSKSLESGDVALKADKARDWLGKHDDVLKRFPDLRNEMEKAIADKTEADRMFRGSSVAGLSEFNKEKTAAKHFLDTDPVNAMDRVISSPGQRRQKLSQMVGIMEKEGNDAARKGLQSSFMENLFNKSESSELTDRFTQLPFISGTRLRDKLEKLENDAVGSGLFSKTEYNRMKAIANRLEGIEKTMMQKSLESGVIEPKAPKKALDLLFQTSAARIAGEASSGSMGGSLQSANIAVREARNLLRTLSQDEAEGLLIKAVRDPETYKRLLKEPLSSVKGAKKSFVSKLVDTAKDFTNRPGISGPAAATTGKGAEEEGEVQKAKRLRNQLRQEQ